MEFKLLYWYWLVFGMVLIIAELFIPSFTIFWFGLGAILVAGVFLVLPDPIHQLATVCLGHCFMYPHFFLVQIY